MSGIEVDRPYVPPVCTRCNDYPQHVPGASYGDGLCWPCRYDDRMSDIAGLTTTVMQQQRRLAHLESLLAAWAALPRSANASMVPELKAIYDEGAAIVARRGGERE